jgi:hypothetical protein
MKDRIDELLDGAIATYVESPRPGLERRVMYRLRTERPAWRLIVPAFALTALVCLVLFFPRHHATPLSARPPLEIHPIAQAHPAPLVKQIPVVSINRKRAFPKQPTFPMATPLTEGERALLALSQQHPEEAARVAVNLKKTVSDLEIEPLEIAPLRSETGQ